MTGAFVLILLVLFAGAGLYWIHTRKPKSDETQPIPEPKPFTPLEDSLLGKFPPVLPQNTLPKERPLPKPRKRPVKKGGK